MPPLLPQLIIEEKHPREEFTNRDKRVVHGLSHLLSLDDVRREIEQANPLRHANSSSPRAAAKESSQPSTSPKEEEPHKVGEARLHFDTHSGEHACVCRRDR